jgi:hypothetical protein
MKAAIQEILQHPPYSPDFAPSDYHLFCSLSNNPRGVFFNKDAELQNWLDDFFTAKPADLFKQTVLSNGGECLIICVKNKLYGSVKRTARTYAPTQYVSGTRHNTSKVFQLFCIKQ